MFLLAKKMKKEKEDRGFITKESTTAKEYEEKLLAEILKKESPKTLIKKLHPFPKKIPLSFNGRKIGDLLIDFDYSLSLEEIFKMSSNRQEMFILFYSHLLDESLSFSSRLESDLVLMDKEWHSIDEAINTRLCKDPFYSLVLMALHDKEDFNFSPLNLFLYMNKDMIFELIKSEGPKILANNAVQKTIELWLRHRDSASIHKLSKCLIKYFNPKDMPLEPGRPKKNIQEENIKALYRYLLPRLQFMNKYEDWDRLDDWERKKINEAGDKAKKDSVPFPPLWPINRKYNMLWRNIIEKDNKLKKEFYEFKWAPFDISIKILSKLTSLSYQKIKYIIYPTPSSV